MRTIWKFTLPSSASVMMLPEGAEILHAGSDPADDLCIWARVDPEKPDVERAFVIHGMGGNVPDSHVYIGTIRRDPYIWHIFEAPFDEVKA